MNVSWGILILYWVISSIKAKRSSIKENIIMQFVLYWLPLILAIYLLGPDERFGNSLIKGNFVHNNNLSGGSGLLLCYMGLLLACRSRYLLGKNWSVSVQKKEDHELVETGAYRLIRHPIYSGLILMFMGNAVIVGRWRGLAGVLILAVSFWFKLKKEERWLTDLFGNRYREYVLRTKALIPWIL
jgi:protein-S-isoprenylcysteine O-methyltransferase Ste14